MAKSLSGLDASFLYLETPEQPMHVASLCVYEVPHELKHDFDAEVVAHLKRRLHLAPIFTNVLAHEKYGLGHPHWEHVDEVDFDYHVQHIKIPKPGSMRQLEAAVAKEPAAVAVHHILGIKDWRDRLLRQSAPCRTRRKGRHGARQFNSRFVVDTARSPARRCARCASQNQHENRRNDWGGILQFTGAIREDCQVAPEPCRCGSAGGVPNA